jgi:hypothetical protein
VDSASAGDTVEVACGTYYEFDIDMKSGVCLRSETGLPDCVTIDGEQQGSVIDCRTADETTRIEGFSITGGSTGGIFLDAATPVISFCLLYQNHAEGWTAGALDLNHSSPLVINCTLVANSVQWDCGTAVACRAGSSPRLENTLIAFNGLGDVICCSGPASNPILVCCDIFGNEGGDWTNECIASQAGLAGNLSVDPQFCSPPEGDYHLGENSPCLAKNSPCSVLIGAFGESCSDSVVQAIDPLNWSTLKALHRPKKSNRSIEQ